MATPEANIYHDAKKQLRMLNYHLSTSSASCDIELHGIQHKDYPDGASLEKLRGADVVTLELSRGVVHAGLQNRDSKVLQKNLFWKSIVDELHGIAENKKIQGIEINQTPRVAWKRFSLHQGVITLTPSPLIIEIQKEHIPNLSSLLDEHELETLQKRNWLITESPEIADPIYESFEQSLNARSNTKLSYPIPLWAGASVVCSNLTNSMGESDLEDYTITFITPPHPSLIEANTQIQQVLRTTGFFDDKEILSVALSTMCTFLLSPAELTEVQEIAYVAKQFVAHNMKSNQKNINVLHLGGAFHTPVLFDIFQASVPIDANIDITSTFDSKASKMNALGTFFRDNISFEHRMEAVKVKGYDVIVTPKLIGQYVKEAIYRNMDKFKAEITAYREHTSKKYLS
jgi:hypothetical protein